MYLLYNANKMLKRIRYYKKWHKHRFDVPYDISFTTDDTGVIHPCHMIHQCKCGELEYPPTEERRISINEAIEELRADSQNDNSWLIEKTERTQRYKNDCNRKVPVL